jgi:hypothetical protein
MDMNESVAAACLNEARDTLEKAAARIRHCLTQLDDDQVNLRPFDTQNSIANIVLHLCGNVRQWIVSGMGAAADVRNRPAEFADRTRYTRQDLLTRLDGVVGQAASVLSNMAPAQLLENRRIQGFDVTVMHALWDTISHFVGHTHQIVYITRDVLRDRYRFAFVPATPEQGAPA